MKLKRLLTYALAAGLALGSGFAISQTFNRAVQLSQDTSGAFLVDTSQNFYLPNKVMTATTSTSVRNTPSITGTGTPLVYGTDTAGLITMGASATTATLVFGTAYGQVPNCIVTSQNGWVAAPTGISYTLATTGIAIVQPSTSTNKLNYVCFGGAS